MGKILSITIQTEGYGGVHQDAFLRTSVNEATLLANHGIEGDRKAGKQPKRQVNLLSQTWLDAQAANGCQTDPGAFGEQMVIAGLDLEGLPIGTKLQLGTEAIGEMTMLRDGCVRLEAAQGREGFAGKPIGIMIRVLTSGQIHVGDEVQAL
ncbi:MAG: MOSC domain-containing protein [Chloroflexota bacterium]